MLACDVRSALMPLSLVAERYRDAAGRPATLRYWRTPKGNHRVEGGIVGAARTFRDVANARAYWRTLRVLMAAAGYERAGVTDEHKVAQNNL